MPAGRPLRVLERVAAQITGGGAAAVATVTRTEALQDHEHFHWVGEQSQMSLDNAPLKKTSNSNQRMFENPIANSMLVADGTPSTLYHASGAHRGLALRYGSADDAPLAAASAAAAVPERLAAAVELIEATPFKDIMAAASAVLLDGTHEEHELMEAAVLAVNRNAELVADHHGGPLHPTAGTWAIHGSAELLRGSGKVEWSRMMTVQLVAIASRHIDVSRKLAGPALLPSLPAAAAAELATADDAIDALREAMHGNRPNRAEAALVRALDLGASRDALLGVMMEQGVPRHVVDDHFTLYPVFAVASLDRLGWESAPIVLRQVVRYLATVPPIAKDLVDKEGFSLISKQGVGGDSDWARVSGICERLGLLEPGAVREQPDAGEDETASSELLGRAIAEDVLRKYTSNLRLRFHQRF